MKDAENKFIKFLKEKGVLQEFKANLANNMGNNGFIDSKAWIKSTDPYDFLLSAFLWGYSNEKERWIAIQREWRVFVGQDGEE